MNNKICLPDWPVETFITSMMKGHMPLSTFSYLFDSTWNSTLLMHLITVDSDYQKHKKDVFELIEKASLKDLDLHYYSFNGFASYHVAVLSGHCDIVKLLLDKIKNNQDEIALTKDSSSILHLAVMSKNLEMIKLVEQYDNNYLQVDLMEDTSLSLAVKNCDNLSIIEYVANQYSIEYLKDFIKEQLPHHHDEQTIQIKHILEAICEHKHINDVIDVKDSAHKTDRVKLKV